MSREDALIKSESTLVAKKIYIESMSFHRKEVSDGNLRLSKSSIGKSINPIDDNKYKCSLMLKLLDENETTVLEVIVSGIFEFRAELKDEQKQIIILKNTMAILFPYLRSQVTLMTSQPDVEPVVLPVININSLLQNLED